MAFGELSKEDHDLIVDCIAFLDEDRKPLSEWELKFMDDYRLKYDRFGEQTNMSAKQKNVLVKIKQKYLEAGYSDAD